MIFLLHKISTQELSLIKGVFPHISPFIFPNLVASCKNSSINSGVKEESKVPDLTHMWSTF